MNRLLRQQLRRVARLGDEADTTQALAELQALSGTGGLSPGSARLLNGLDELLQRISASYDHHERDLALRERSLQLSSEELEEAQNKLLLLNRTDRLTQLWNRGHWQERLQEAFERHRRSGADASLLIMDIDHFKAINDRYGHPAGDQVICRVAQTLREHSRQTDVCARYGGEEFSIILPDTRQPGASAYAESLRKKIEALDIETDHGHIRFTISIGVAETSTDFQHPDHWLVCADQALYQAKRDGRNRVSSFASPSA